MEGRPATCAPVWMKVMAGSWLIASVWIDLTMQISSAIFAVCGSSSLIHAPDSPYCLNLNIELTTGKAGWVEVIEVRRCPLRIDPGKSRPRHCGELWLVVEQLHLRRPT